MKQSEKKKLISPKTVYDSPSITEIRISTDIMTLSHQDPNMGEWDTQG